MDHDDLFEQAVSSARSAGWSTPASCRSGWASPAPLHALHSPDIDAAIKTITENGGQILHGPDEIPGGDFIVKGFDPQGALFALVGSRRT